MLIEQDFAYSVSQVKINGVKCWKYLGTDLKEAGYFARTVHAAGEKFYNPLTSEVTGVHTTVLDKVMVTLLIAVSHYHKYNDCLTMANPEEFPLLNSSIRRFATVSLVHFGLLKRERDTTRYLLTETGMKFVEGKWKVRPVMFNSGSQIHGYDESIDRVDVESFFTQNELGEMRKPLWFLPEKNRQEILTDKELATI